MNSIRAIWLRTWLHGCMARTDLRSTPTTYLSPEKTVPSRRTLQEVPYRAKRSQSGETWTQFGNLQSISKTPDGVDISTGYISMFVRRFG